jgi:hypothetical protein
MHPTQDFDRGQGLPPNWEALSQDLDLEALWGAMASGDGALFEVAQRALLCSLTDAEAIAHRQRVLVDCLRHPAVVREMYETAVAALTGRRRIFGFTPAAVLDVSVRTLAVLLPYLRKLRVIAAETGPGFSSEGFQRLFAALESELDEEYLQMLEGHLARLRFPQGVLLSARLGPGNAGTDYTVRLPRDRGWKDRLAPRRSRHTLRVSLRDDESAASLSRIRGRGLNPLADALAQSADHVLGFFRMLRTELGFYTGCLNLHERLAERGEPVCLPAVATPGERDLSATGLYDVCLALRTTGPIVGNDIGAWHRRLVMVTGANGGGKSTFLRSVGVAQLMMQSGMFVPARALRADIAAGVFTHFRREEDAGLEKGKLDEELSRISEIVDGISPGCLLLCNESVASTNEAEGSEIARQIVKALTDSGVKVFYVTHLYDLAQGLYAQRAPETLFLRAERQSDGARSFKLREAGPLPTGFGEDLYRQVFGVADGRAPAAAAGSPSPEARPAKGGPPG